MLTGWFGVCYYLCATVILRVWEGSEFLTGHCALLVRTQPVKNPLSQSGALTITSLTLNGKTLIQFKPDQAIHRPHALETEIRRSSLIRPLQVTAVVRHSNSKSLRQA